MVYQFVRRCRLNLVEVLKASFQEDQTLFDGREWVSIPQTVVVDAENWDQRIFPAVVTRSAQGRAVDITLKQVVGSFVDEQFAYGLADLAVANVSGEFQRGETITSSSGASGVVTDVEASHLIVRLVSGSFQTDDTITGATSNATATITSVSGVTYEVLGGTGDLTVEILCAAYAQRTQQLITDKTVLTLLLSRSFIYQKYLMLLGNITLAEAGRTGESQQEPVYFSRVVVPVTADFRALRRKDTISAILIE